MGTTSQTAPPAEPQSPPASTGGRPWYIDEIVVAAFAIFGVVGGVFLPLRYDIPPITTSFLLATGLAALSYRFLGGIPGTSLTVGALKLGGALAALVGIALIINNYMVGQLPKPHQVWQVTGQALDPQGNPIEIFAPGDIAVSPATVHTGLNGKFSLTVTSWPDINGNQQMPSITVSHAPFKSENIDLNTGAKNDVSVTRDGQSIEIGPIKLESLGQYVSTEPARPVPPAAGPAPGATEQTQ
jgi:hypothetical protein